MASLSEMLQYAEAQQRPDPVAEGLSAAIRGGFQGYNAGLKEKTASVQRAKDITEIEMKVKEMKMQENMAKYFGFLPYSPEELKAGRDASFDELGTKPKPHTKAGSLEQFYNPDKENLSKTWSAKSGFSLNVRPKSSTSKAESLSSQRAEKSAIESLATKMALRNKSQEFKNAGRRDEEIGMLMMGYQPTMDEVKKFYPLAQKYYGADPSQFEDLYNEDKDKSDPQRLFDDEGEN